MVHRPSDVQIVLNPDFGSAVLLKNTAAIKSLSESYKIYKPNIKKSLMTNKINDWQKAVSILTKNYP